MITRKTTRRMKLFRRRNAQEGDREEAIVLKKWLKPLDWGDDVVKRAVYELEWRHWKVHSNHWKDKSIYVAEKDVTIRWEKTYVLPWSRRPKLFV